MAAEWLSLSEAAAILGVHPSTVRSWSDKGRLPVHRTQGGHRRFRRADVELWTQSQQIQSPDGADLVAQNALGRTRFQISEGRIKEEPWYHKLDRDARRQYRRSGRSLLQGLTRFLQSDRDLAASEAQALGFEYAAIARRCGLQSAEAVRAFLFFRNLLVDSMITIYETAVIQSPYVWGDTLRKINTFTDQVLLALLDRYQAFENRKS